MTAYTLEAEAQVDALREHYVRKGRIEVVLNLDAALERAEQHIARSPEDGRVAPRPYPALAGTGRRWTKAGRYWVAYSTTIPPVIVAVFYDMANMPGRAR